MKRKQPKAVWIPWDYCIGRYFSVPASNPMWDLPSGCAWVKLVPAKKPVRRKAKAKVRK